MADGVPSSRDLDALTASLQSELARHSEVHFAILFGSQASGAATADSDADLAILSDDIDGSYLAADLSQACHLQVDLISLDNPSIVLLEEVIRNGVLVYEGRANSYAAWRSHALTSLETDRPWYNRMRDAWLEAVAERGL